MDSRNSPRSLGQVRREWNEQNVGRFQIAARAVRPLSALNTNNLLMCNVVFSFFAFIHARVCSLVSFRDFFSLVVGSHSLLQAECAWQADSKQYGWFILQWTAEKKFDPGNLAIGNAPVGLVDVTGRHAHTIFFLPVITIEKPPFWTIERISIPWIFLCNE